MRAWVTSYDLVIDMRWGDSFSDIYGLRRLVGMNAFTKIVSDAGIPIVLGPQTLGPFNSRVGRIVAKRAAARYSKIIARDIASANYGSEIGLRTPILGTDAVFAIPVPEATKRRDVAVNVSGLLWNENTHVDHLRYQKSIISVCKELPRSGRDVTLLAHVLDSETTDNDVPAVMQARDQIGDDVRFFIPDSLDDLRSFVAESKLVIGARMHACLNALSVGTPAIAMAYSRKFVPLLEGMGWERTVDLRGPDRVDDKILEICNLRSQLDAEVSTVRGRVEPLLKATSEALEGSVPAWRNR